MNFMFLFFAANLIAVSQTNDCNCRIKSSNRIVNGTVAKEHSIPWIVSINKYSQHICGGSILNEKYILTAAHCVINETAQNLDVHVGIHNIKENTPKNQIYKVIKIHKMKFKKTSELNDIAILELSRNITFIEDVVEKGCFNLKRRRYTDKLLAAGWGFTNKTFINPKTGKAIYSGHGDYLKQAYFIEKIKCRRYLICVKSIFEGDSTCDGDSGGPLHYTENGLTSIEGIDSFKPVERNYACIGKGGFSRLSYYADWISETAEFNFCGTKPKQDL